MIAKPRNTVNQRPCHAAYRVRTSFSRRTLFSMYESNGFIGIAYYIRGISGI